MLNGSWLLNFFVVGPAAGAGGDENVGGMPSTKVVVGALARKGHAVCAERRWVEVQIWIDEDEDPISIG
jgi:hypothetical protein